MSPFGKSLAPISALLASACLPAMAQVTFNQIAPAALVNSISADGSVVVGVIAEGTSAFRWTQAEGFQNLGGDTYRASVSRDGRTVVAAARDTQGIKSAAIWQGGRNWRTLGGIPGGVPDEATKDLSSGLAVSGDGSIIVGHANVPNHRGHAFRWDATNGMVDLGVLSGISSSAFAISADGKVIVGWDEDTAPFPSAGRHGVVWWEGKERLIHPFGYAGTAAATNHNGSWIVGQWHPTNNQPDGLATTYKLGVWDGLLENLGAVRQNPIVDRTQATSEPYAMSDDGRVVVGENGGATLRASLGRLISGPPKQA